MILRVLTSTAEKIGVRKFKEFGLSEDGWGHRKYRDLDLETKGTTGLKKIEALFDEHKSVHGVGTLLRDLETWRAALKDREGVKPRTVLQFSRLARRYLSKAPHHYLYRKSGDLWLVYYVTQVEYHPEDKRQDYYRPAYTEVDLVYEEFEGQKSLSVSFFAEDSVSIPIVEAFARKGYYAETPARRAAYLAERERYRAIVPQIGTQYWAGGFGSDDGMDGNPDEMKGSWYFRSTRRNVKMGDEETPARVVIDVFKESESEDKRERHVNLHSWFWKGVPSGGDEDDDDENENTEEELSETVEPEEIEVPVHPFLAVFHLGKHLRLRVHVNYLQEYVYDPTIIDRLVIDESLKSLVRLLLQHGQSSFEDIVRGKSGGAVVLLSGPPGTGKTLTAEVFAEAEGRALYSIQCSQLGTDPDDLEKELLKCFSRAKRWKAVMLLDEADVYVHERGRDLDQNAIVGVFLRVLEYQSNLLFLTTNRPDDVDDAIASRCIARLSYRVPTTAQQKKIWEVLAAGAKGNLRDPEIDAIVRANPALSGRDVKNLLKLAILLRGDREITADAIEFVKQFKPTGAGPLRQAMKT